MEFIEKKYHDILNRLKKLTLKKVMMLYFAMGLAAAFCSVFFVIRFAEIWRKMIYFLEEPSKATTMAVQLFMVESVVIILLVSGIIFLVCHLFYRRRMEPGIEKIEQEIQHLRREDLSYDCSLEGEDEMSIVCRSLNDMRIQLLQNCKDTWELLEQQRLINGAFAHDIRTPLTVINGYIQMIEKFYPEGKMSREKLLENIAIISRQVTRIEQFSETMKNVNHIGEWDIVYKETTAEKLLEVLESNLRGMTEGKNISSVVCKGELQKSKFFCDLSIIQEVADNLILNALRYAVLNIIVTVEIEKSRLFLYVQDDGPGFSPESLEKGSRPYFSTEKNHMGMGLALCKILCKKHRGDLELINSIQEGGIACAIFGISQES